LTELQIHWFSPRTKEDRIAWGRDLTPEQANNLAYRVFNHYDWPELKKFIEEHEQGPINYLLAGSNEETPGVIKLKLLITRKQDNG
jgi:ABC-type phosphate/phosphonate transport system substrate-binding protein